MKKLSRIEKLMLMGLCIEAATGVIGGSMILAQTKPYFTLIVLAIGAVATKIVAFIERKEHKNNEASNNTTNTSNSL